MMMNSINLDGKNKTVNIDGNYIEFNTTTCSIFISIDEFQRIYECLYDKNIIETEDNIQLRGSKKI